MQELMLADDLFGGLDEGWKRGTVRAGRRDLTPGPLRLRAADGTLPDRVVEVARVSYVAAGRMSDADARLDGAASPADLLAALRRFYPALGPADLVTVVEFA